MQANYNISDEKRRSGHRVATVMFYVSILVSLQQSDVID